MLRSWQRTAMTLGTLVMLAAWPSAVNAHGKGVLTLADRRLVAGDTARITGTRFTKNSRLALLLVGSAGRTPLGEVRADAAGAFQAAPVIPMDLPTGSYRLIVAAADGDEVGAADVELVAAAARGHATTHVDRAPEPTARALSLTRARNPWLTGGALIVIAASIAVGALLLRRPARA